MTRIAVTSRSFSRNPTLRAELQSRYPEVTFHDATSTLSGEQLIEFLKGHSRAIVALDHLDDAVFAQLPDLRVISKYGVGFDKIDLGAMARRGIRLGWTGGVNRRSVSELTLAFAILLLRYVPTASRALRDGQWQPRVGRQLSDATVGIIGCGHIGKDITALLHNFGCRILVHDIQDFPDFFGKWDVTPVDLETLLQRADVVTLHLPLNASTANLIDSRRLRLMKPGAVLINTARGGLIDEDALKLALKEGRLAGAAFDVFSIEPPADTELLQLPNFFGTPHIGGTTEEAILAMGRAAIRGLDENQIPDPHRSNPV